MFSLDGPAFELDVDAFARAALANNARIAVVVSPNNPTGLTVPRADLLRLASSLRDHGCQLIVDESFLDFSANREDLTVEPFLGETPNLAVLKSLSKSFGIGGLRLGYLVTADTHFREMVRSELHIWNINSFAESFLRLAPSYRRAFLRSCARVREDCDELQARLGRIPGVVAYKSEANFVMCRLPPDSADGPTMAKRMFMEHNLFIKHCAGKPMPDADRYLRIASRTKPDNDVLIAGLAQLLAT